MNASMDIATVHELKCSILSSHKINISACTLVLFVKWRFLLPSFIPPLSSLRDFIIDGLSVERNHILVRMSVIGGLSERRLPPRALQKVSALLLAPLDLT